MKHSFIFGLPTVLITSLLCSICLSAPTLAAQTPAQTPPQIDVTIETDIYHYAQNLLKQDDIAHFTAFDRSYCQRDVVEFVLVQKALLLGGSRLHFRFVEGNYDARNVRLVADGLLLISFDTVWFTHAQQYQAKVYISDPMIEKGEYETAIFVGKKYVENYHVSTLEDLRQLSFVSSKDWPQDWHLLSSIQPKKLLHEGDWISMAKMVSRGWVDAMLIPFTQQQPFVYEGAGYQLQALPNVKLALDDSRHFIVSKAHPLGAEVFAALQRGLRILRERDEIHQAYIKCGFFNPSVQHWRLLNKSLLELPVAGQP